MVDAPNPVTPSLGFRNMARQFLRQLPFFVGGTALLTLTTDLGVGDAFHATASVMLLGLLLWGAGSLARQFRARGRLLQDCGPHPKRWLFIATGAIWVAIGAIALVSAEGIDAAFLATKLWIYLGAAGSIAMAFGRLQVVENGIWSFWGLLRWDQIRAYRWTVDSTLWTETDARPGILGPHRGAMPVPPEHVERIEALLVRNGVLEGADPGLAARIPA